jgi:hypothetical protein
MKVDYKFENTKLIVTVDGDQDGVALVTLAIDLAEIPSEILSLIAKK